MPASSKERKPRQRMPEQEASDRAHNFAEVALGLTEEMAVAEASRCLGCKKPKCVEHCPVAVDIPGFLALVKAGKFGEAAALVREKNSLPAMCGRVCPQENQCEGDCVLGKKGEPVAIGYVERFLGDYALGRGYAVSATPDGPKIAVVGSGPAGLTAAGDLAQAGYRVTVFEALHDAGGVLRYGIPNFRLPKDVLNAELQYLRTLGVEIRPNAVIGRLFTVPSLLESGYRAVFIGTGAGTPHFLRIAGENLNGVYSANEFLTRVNLMQAYRFGEVDTPITVGERVAVVGGGNVAMDSARVALRLGAKEVTIVYRRSRTEMPARAEEVVHAEDEGIRFEMLTNPTRLIQGGDFCVSGLECLRMELGEPDASGRRRPVPKRGSEFIVQADTVVIAIGSSANPLIQQTTPGLKVNDHGYIVTDEVTGLTSIPGVYAGGDVVTGSATVIQAMGAGRRASVAIQEYVSRT
ncbi:MAG: NADPH-dependent glutamate synthase [Armatimonadota bacterium]